MKERPILFNGEMVRAILEGRKTQTRRLLRRDFSEMFQEPSFGTIKGDWFVWETEYPEDGSIQFLCPFGQVGDRLWVRETFYRTKLDPRGFIYRADATRDDSDEREGYWVGGSFIPGTLVWTPSIHMPRSASRITLEITGVRVERLQEVSEEDAKAEGIGGKDTVTVSPVTTETYREAFKIYWDNMYGFSKAAQSRPGKWAANPWVWVIEFRTL